MPLLGNYGQTGTPLAKLSVPRSAVWVVRDRLFRRLDALRGYPMIWVSAPAGAGKTVLAASYLQQHKLPALWYNLDSGDGDPASFFYYLRFAVQALAPNNKLALTTLAPDYRPGLGLFATNFFREVYKAFPGGGVMVLDDLQEVDRNEEFVLLLKTAAREAPKGVTLLCLSRSDPPPGLSRLALNRALASLTWDDLKWTDDEIRALARALSLENLPGDVLTALNEKAHGWAAGLVLLLQDAGGLNRLHPGGAADQTLFNYFAGEIMDRLPAREQEFLVQTAVLPVVTAHLAGALTGVGDPGTLLSYLVDKNYFTVRLERPSESYRYHPLFREFLLQKAARNLSAPALADLRRRAAQLLLEGGDPETAVPLLLEAGVWEPFTNAVCDIAPQLIANGRHQCLSGWLDHVPREIIEATPWLLYWKAAALMPVDLAASYDLFARAFDATLADEDHVCMAMSWAGAVETIVHSLSHTERMDEWIGKLHTLDRRAHLETSPGLQVLVAPQAVAICAVRGKLASQLEAWVPRAERMLDGPFDTSQRILASFALVTYFHWSGQPSRSIPILKKQEAILASGDATPLSAITTKLSTAWFSWLYGQFDRCAKAIEEGLEIVAKTGVQHWTFLLQIQGAVSALIRDDLREAERFLSRLEPLYARARDMDRVYFHNELARLKFLRGRPDQALHEQLAAVELARSVGAPFVIAETCYGLSQVYHALGQRELAEHYLAEVRYQGQLYGGSQALDFQSGLAESYYRLAAHDGEGVARVLAATFVQARQQGYCAFGWWLGEMVASLCHFALERDIEPTFARTLIRQFQVLPTEEAQHSEKWPWPARITTFGQFTLVVDDIPVTFDRKAQRRPLELLKALVALGGRDVPEGQLIDALWPDADADLAHQNLKSAMHRLRKLIPSQAITVTDGKLSIDQRYCWLDTSALDAIVHGLEQVLPSGSAVSLAATCSRLKSIYRGGFLEGGADASWAIVPRERYRARFLGAMERLGEALLSTGEYEVARDCYEYGLAVDPLIELFYQGLMRSYWGLGRPAEVQMVLNRCRQVLKISLGLDCSPETEAFACGPRSQ